MQERLDSWKAIADYLDRDVATVRRWEKSLRLPVRRVPGGRGRSVFAFRHEIDEWLRASQGGAPSPARPIADPAGDAPVPDVTAVIAAPPRTWRTPVAATAILGLVVLAALFWKRDQVAADHSLALDMLPERIVARGPDGTERWRHEFPGARVDYLAGRRFGPQTPLADNAGFLVGTQNSTRIGSSAVESGQLLWLDLDGRLQRRMAFDDRLTFGNTTYASPWVLADYRLPDDLDPARVAVAARHHEWWPGIVSILDAQWRPTARFINAGWVEHLAWIGRDRLVISGYYNPLEGGMVALLDAATLGGQSPPDARPEFTCASCGEPTARRYVVLPRSELNRALRAPFNRAMLHLSGDRIVVRTIEEPNPEGYAAEALYAFTRDLELVSATYGDRYWDRHQALEAAGKIDHPRERCPERRGPPHVLIWERARGWTTVQRPPD